MGLADAFGKDDRTEIRTDDLIELVRESEKCRMLLKAADAEIPYSDIRKIFNQGNDILRRGCPRTRSGKSTKCIPRYAKSFRM